MKCTIITAVVKYVIPERKGLQMKKSIITLLCAASMIISTPSIAETLRIKKNAPARYTVKKGDTLWGISGKYLYRPWKWPKLWQINRNKIKNPHLIYPGQVLVLRYVNGRPVLGVEGRGGIPTIKLSPKVRDDGSGYGINTIDVDFYKMFMKHPQFVTGEDFLQKTARIVAGPDGRTLYTIGDRIYADGITQHGDYLIFRVKNALKDPRTQQNLGQLVEFVGEAKTLSTPDSALSHRSAEAREALLANEYYAETDEKYFSDTKNGMTAVRTAQPLMITQGVAEITKHDYLIPKPEGLNSFNFMPHEPSQSVQADIIDIMEGISESGTMQTIILNKGVNDGVDRGTVLGVYKRSRVIQSPWGGATSNNPKEEPTRLVNTPVEEIALAMVYRAGRNVSSAIILESVKSVSKEDLLAEPGRDLDTLGTSQRIPKPEFLKFE